MFSYDKLPNFFKTNFAMMQHHKYNLSDIENMMPWERAIYIDMLQDHLKKLEEQNRDRAAVNARRR
ncbi:hypothetical protein UFOVP908_178 [uncultured Caudovirales phage]|jgi:hypothetical protein|uniref:Baseplate hub assembly protein n=1 Tax=uncultured Caudovirales phage TaxID=2100421 RepID=A0A6J7XFD4_9CAUD|nr:hypothetical protein UFOVP908_178 [uncultured Caudovirales phage]CAB4177124.1 hypothetical protein UFOVP990_191 [uncultured Caudovirales phage]CAB4182332.1 hypothetical protein UFOVP1065_222 [uncultured Caudovirales phage]CAB4190851.1 hypothetical protein UFOVP1198_191 [uncultured Caudovirales phage]CAB4211200.1 hypothetical protein UFOVP1418_183 [uncultured Caudovirales phage]